MALIGRPSWLHWSSEERRRGDFIRDQWMRDTLRAMGHPSARGLFVHLYLKEIESALVAESARWGDYRRDAHPYRTGPYELYTRNDHRRPEIDRLLNEYFPKRTEVVVRSFREAGLYPKED